MIKLKDLGEEAIIKKLLEELSEHAPVGSWLEKDDDVQAVFSDEYALKIDGYTSAKSRYPWEPWWIWGWKAVTGVISDLSAKGYRGIGIAYSIGMPPEEEFSKLKMIVNGIKEALKKYNLLFLGADTNASEKDIWIDIAGIGRLATKKPIPRRIRSDRKGMLFTTVKNGFGATGLLAYYYYILKQEPPEELKNYIPTAVIEFPDIARDLDPLFSIDTSDGLSKSLWIIAEKNNLQINLTSLPINKGISRICEELDYPVEKAILNGGEEYEIIFAVKEERVDKTVETCRKYGVKCMMIGEIETREKPIVYYRSQPIERSGWDQFRNYSTK